MKGHRLFIYFFVDSFIVASLLIYLYRAIETDIHIYAFLFLSSLIVMFFCAFLLELMFIEPVIDKIIDLAQESKLFYNFLLMSLLFTIVVILPPKIIHGANTLLENKEKTNPGNCSLVLAKLLESPKSVYDTKLLSKCEYTQPLAKIIPTEGDDIDKIAQNLPLVIEEYMGLFSQNLSFALTTLFAILGGASYSVLVVLIIKKGALLILWLFNSSARKMIVDGTSPPGRKAMMSYSKFSSGKQLAEPIKIETVAPKEQSAQDLLEQGNKNYYQQKYEEAIRDYTEAILKAGAIPQIATIYNYRGAARYNSNDHDGAIKDFGEAIYLIPDFPDYYFNRGVAYRATGNLADANKDFDDAVRLNPDNADYYYNRGIIRRSIGDPDGAIKDFDEAIRIKPDNADGYNNRGLARRVSDDLDGAMQDFNEAIHLDSNNAEYYYNRAIEYRTKGEIDNAIADYDKAIHLKPDYASAYNNRGHARRTIGDLEGALADLSEAIRLKPDHGLARLNLFGLLLKLGKDSDIDEEENLVRELIQKENEYNQACFEAICGNADKAFELLKIGLAKKQWSKQWASREPNFENIRNDPRFKELVGE